jgi:hypothetical protein
MNEDESADYLERMEMMEQKFEQRQRLAAPKGGVW